MTTFTIRHDNIHQLSWQHSSADMTTIQQLSDDSCQLTWWAEAEWPTEWQRGPVKDLPSLYGDQAQLRGRKDPSLQYKQKQH